MENNTGKGQKKSAGFPLPPKKSKNTGYKRYVKFIWVGLIAIVLGVSALFFAVSQGFLGDMPNVQELENPDIYVASQIISADGVVLGNFEKEKTQPVTYKELPPFLVYALQAKEDERFKEHSGIDLKSIARAVFFRGGRGGGSTISQQLAKLLFTKTASQNKVLRAIQKLKEWSLAVSLERIYTKDEIITLYFNKFDFLFNANGVEMASQVYFNKKTSELTLPEAATFVAMLENPVKNNPYRHPENAKIRRDVVLKQMLDTGYLDNVTYQKAISEPIKVDFHPIKSIDQGYSAYYKYYLRQEIDAYLKDYEKKTGKEVNLYKDGLKIYVTLDSKMQTYAEEAIKEHLTDLQKNFNNEQRGRKLAPFYFLNQKEIDALMLSAIKRTGRYQQLKAENVPEDSIMLDFKTPTKMLRFTWNGDEEVEMTPYDSIRYSKQIAQSGLMSMDPSTGDIKAWVGGINWQHYQYDHVKQGKRQVGSTFKPFVYAAAIINLGKTPCSIVSNAPFQKKNYRVSESGPSSMTFKEALARSQNPPAVRTMDEVGPENVIKLARDMGVTSDMQSNLTTALGSSDITIYEMLGAYNTFAHFGTYIKPEMIWRISDPSGFVIKELKPAEKEVMNELYAYSMIDMMKGVTQPGGTAYAELSRRGISSAVEIAAKTGTTQNNSDGWFMGLTPKLATGVWVGWEDRATHFASTGEGQGARMALPIWAIFMKKVWADKSLNISPDDKFLKPSNWTGNCDDLRGLGTGYGDEGGLKTIDQIKNPEPIQPKKSPAKKEDNVNEKLNSSDDVDFNK